MRLYSIQPLTCYETLLRGDPWHVDLDQSEHLEPSFRRAYQWLASQMKARGILPHRAETKYPVWAWHWWNGEGEPRPDLTSEEFLETAAETPSVLLTLEVPDNEVLLSDLEAWHWVLNGSYFGPEDRDDDFIERCHVAGAAKLEDNSLTDAALQAELEETWPRIFNISGACEITGHAPGENSVQATFWELTPEYVLEVERFDRNGLTSRLAWPP